MYSQSMSFRRAAEQRSQEGFRSSGPASEKVLQPELNLALIGDDTADFSESRRVSPLRSYGCVRVAEIHVVKSIEKLRPKLKSTSLGDSNVLKQAEVPRLQTWTNQSIPAEIPVRVGRGNRKRRSVEPLGLCAIEAGGLGITNDVWPLVGARCPSF